MKFCINCAWHNNGQCYRKYKGIDLVTGESNMKQAVRYNEFAPLCSEERKNKWFNCGELGKFFLDKQ